MRNLFEQTKIFNKLNGVLLAAFHAEYYHSGIAALEVLVGKVVIFVVFEAGVSHPFRHRVFFERAGKSKPVAAVSRHTKVKRFDPSESQIGVERTHAGADVAHILHTSFQNKRRPSAFLDVNRAVITFVGSIKIDVAWVTVEIEISGVDNAAADARRLTVEIFRRAVDNYIRAVLYGPYETRRSKGIVNDKKNSVFFADARISVEVEYYHCGIGDGFGKHKFGSVIDKIFDFLVGHIGRKHSGRYAVFRQSMT